MQHFYFKLCRAAARQGTKKDIVLAGKRHNLYKLSMKVILAKSAGFCMGVRRAVETTLDVIQRADGSVSTFGPLIHNPQVLDLLGESWVKGSFGSLKTTAD